VEVKGFLFSIYIYWNLECPYQFMQSRRMSPCVGEKFWKVSFCKEGSNYFVGCMIGCFDISVLRIE
jgi:hypothetical protein